METELGEKERSPPGATWTVTVVAAVAVVARMSATRSDPSELAIRLFLFKSAPSAFGLFINGEVKGRSRGLRSDRLVHRKASPGVCMETWNQEPTRSAALELSLCNACSDFSYLSLLLLFWPSLTSRREKSVLAVQSCTARKLAGRYAEIVGNVKSFESEPM